MATKSADCSELSGLGPTSNGLWINAEELGHFGRRQKDFLIDWSLHTHEVDVPFAPFEGKVSRGRSVKTRVLFGMMGLIERSCDDHPVLGVVTLRECARAGE